MEKQSYSRFEVISFHRWIRKAFAVFSSLGKLIRIGVLSLSCSILVLTGYSKENPDTLAQYPPDSIKELDEVVVSAQLAPMLQSELMRVVQIISRPQIQQSPSRDLAGLLNDARGVDIRSRGAFGMQADIGIRGGTFDQTMVLINGINITDPQTGHHNLNIPLDISSIERIEILQGAGARVFGPNAFSGAVNIITRKPVKPYLGLFLEGGQHKFSAAGLSGVLKTGNISHHLSLQGMRTDGFTDNTDFSALNIYYRGIMEGGNYEIDAQAAFSQKAFGANSFYTPRFPEQFEEIQTGMVSLQWIPKGKLKLKSSLYWRRNHDRFELFRNVSPDWYNDHNYHLTDVIGAGLNWTHAGAYGKSSLGADLRFEHIFSTVLGKPMNNLRQAAGYSDVFFTHSWQRRGLSLMGEHIFYLQNFSLSAGMLTWVNPELEKGVGLFPGLDAGWQFLPAWKWFASVNRTLRLPTFTDLFYSGPTNLGNALLQPEKAISTETGLKTTINGWALEMTGFRRWGQDMIDWVRRPGEEQWKSMNLTNVNFTGFEAALAYHNVSLFHPQYPASFSLHYTYMTADKSSGEFVSNYALDYLSHKAGLHALVPFAAHWGVSTSMAWIDRAGAYMVYEDGEFTRMADFRPWWSLDTRFFYRYGVIELYAEVTNLLNEPGVTIANVPQPGRWIRMGIKTELGF